MRAWDPESRILAIDRGRARESTGMSCQPIAGYEREMFSAGCTMNIGSKKLLREVASTFCGAHGSEFKCKSVICISNRINTGEKARDNVSGQLWQSIRGSCLTYCH
jgi:hypothetical protein